MKHIIRLLITLSLFISFNRVQAQYKSIILDGSTLMTDGCGSSGCQYASVNTLSYANIRFYSPNHGFISGGGIDIAFDNIWCSIYYTNGQRSSIAGITLMGEGAIDINGLTIPFNFPDPTFLALPTKPTNFSIQGVYTIYDMLYNGAPMFVDTTTVLTACNGSAVDLTNLLAVTDADAAQTLHWNVVTPPSAGTLTFTGGTGTSGSLNITPTGTFSFTPPASGQSQTFKISVTDGADTVYKTFTVNVNTPPMVSTITRSNPTTSYVNSISNTATYQVAFNTSVTGVDAGDFTLTTTGGVTGSIGSVTGSGSSYLVQVNTLTGNGTIRLDVNAAGTGISANGCSLPAGYTSAPIYNIDHTAPTITSVDVPAPGNYTTGQNLDFTVHYSEVIRVDNTEGTPSIPITLGTGGTVNAVYVSGNGTADLLFRYTVTSGVADFDGITVGTSISLNFGILKDSANNSAIRTLNNVGNTTGVLVNAIANDAPVFIGGASATITLCSGATTSLADMLHVNDTNSNQTLTWTLLAQPGNGGAVTVSGAAAVSGGTDITPAGTLSYTAGSAGTESFKIIVSDGFARDTFTISANITANPLVNATSSASAVCYGSSVTLSATGATSYVWSATAALSSSTGANVISTVNASQTYTVTGTTGSCSSSATVSVNIRTVAPMTIGSVSPVCQGTTSINLPFALPADSAVFTYTGAVQNYTVPADIDSVDADVFGAAGDTYSGRNFNGDGGRVRARIPVTAGQVLNLYVGGINRFNGGGLGFKNGGDASDIRIGGFALIDRKIVAGGGGGNGFSGEGGDGGTTSGGSSGFVTSHTAATGGTQSSGGVAGHYSGGFLDFADGNAGTLGVGGSGSTRTGDQPGGGGGGYYGGGGGAYRQGGGGGSSYADPLLCNRVYMERGVNKRNNPTTWVTGNPLTGNGNGFIIITPVKNYTYAISWDAGAVTAGFSNISNQPLPESSLPLNIPSNVAPGTYSGNIILSDGHCAEPFHFEITVKERPVLSTTSDMVKCAGQPTGDINFSALPSGTDITWTNTNTATGLGSSGNGSITSFNTINSTTTKQVSTVIVNSQLNGCAGNSDTFTITSYPVPALNAVSNQAICNADASTTITFSSTIDTATYSWNNNTPSIGLAASGTGNIEPFTAANTGSTPVVATVTVTATAFGCSSSGSFNVTINPTPAVTTGPDAVICNGDNTTISATGATSYSWAPATGLTATTGTSVTAHPSTTTTYTVTGTTLGCNNTSSVTVTVKPMPTVDVISSQQLCNGSSTTLISFSGEVSGTTYTWTNNNTSTGLASSGTGNIASFTASNAGNTNAVSMVTVTPTAAGCTGQPVTFAITVHPTPTVDSITDISACNDYPMPNVIFSGAVSGTTYNWTNSNTSIGLSASATGVSNINSFTGINNSDTTAIGMITVTPVANSCLGASRTFAATVRPTPSVNTITNKTVCNTATVEAIPFTGPVTGTIFGWTNNDTSIGLEETNVGDIPAFTASNNDDIFVVATVTVTPTAAGCEGPERTFTIRVNPTPGIAPTTDKVVCNEADVATIEFDGTGAPGFAGAAATSIYSWTNSNSTIGLASGGTGNINAFTAVNTSADPITATVVVTPSALGCIGASDTFDITVNPTPGLTTTLTSAPICNNLTFHYNPASATTGTTYQWSRATVAGIANTSANGINDPAEILTNTAPEPVTVTYVYTLTANSCNNTQEVTVVVNPTPALSSTLTPAPVCDSSLFSYTPASATTGTTYIWQRLSVAGIDNAVATGSDNPMEYLKNTTPAPVNVQYVYTLTANSCSNEQLVTVTVYPTPLLSSPVAPAPVCDSTIFEYHPASFTSGTTYVWSRAAVPGISNPANADNTDPDEYLDNTTAAPVTVTYVYTLTANGCHNMQNVVVTVNPTPMLSSGLTIAPVCDSALVSYVPASAVAGTTFSWSRDTITGITNPAASGTDDPLENLVNTTPFPVTLQYVYTLAANGCTNVQHVSATVNPKPLLSSTLSPAAICDSALFSYTPESLTGGTAFAWNRPAVTGIANTTATGADNPAENLYNTTADPVSVGYIYTLTSYGCTNSQQVNVVVNPTPKLNALFAPAICNNTVFNYTPASATTGTTFAWSRPAISGISNPAATGVDNPMETLTNTTTEPVGIGYVYTNTANGCSFVQVVNTTVNPTPVFTSAPTASICSGAPFSYTPASATSGTSYTWTRAAAAGISNVAGSGSGNVSETLLNTTLAPKVATYAYTLTANGCSNPQTLLVTVNPTPAPPVIAITSPATVCSKTMYQNFGAATEAPDTVDYTWTATGAVVYAQGQGGRYSVVSFPYSGAANVILTANATGFACYSRDTFGVSVAASEVNNAEIYYVNDHFIYIDNTVDRYQWGYDDAATLDSVIYTGQVDQNMYIASPDFAGKRYWVMTTKGDCQTKTYYNAPVGITQVATIERLQINVFPNPASNNVAVAINGLSTNNATIELTDITGKIITRVVTDNNKTVLNVSDLASGVYMITCYSNGVKAGTTKLVKE